MTVIVHTYIPYIPEIVTRQQDVEHVINTHTYIHT